VSHIFTSFSGSCFAAFHYSALTVPGILLLLAGVAGAVFRRVKFSTAEHDLVGIVSGRRWLPFALCFLNAYGDADVIAELKTLAAPGGLAWIWWGVRTNFTKPTRVRRRLTRLRNAITRGLPINGNVSHSARVLDYPVGEAISPHATHRRITANKAQTLCLDQYALNNA